MRVLLVGPYPLDSAVTGGVQASFANLVSGLAEMSDLDVHVVSFVPGLDRPIERHVGTVRIDQLPGSPRLSFATRHAREREALSEVIRARRPDVVHAQDALGAGYVCLRAAQGVPVLVSIHGITREEAKYKTGAERLRSRVFGVAVERYCIRHAQYLVQPTRYPEAYFGSEIHGRIWDVGNAISDRFFEVDPTPEQGRMLYAGSLIPRKRLLDLVEAMPAVVAHVPRAHLRVTGGGLDEPYARKVRARICDLDLGGRVELIGSVDFGGLLEEFRRASVLVLPSGEETSPMVIGEAMATGVPVVATRVGGVSYLVDHGVTGLIVDPGDVDSLAAAVSDILGDPARSDAFGAAGRAKAEGGFRTAAVAARVRAVYDEICGPNPTARKIDPRSNLPFLD
jgi:glycosyltransferase involved in cell wall biosynthesis